MRKWAGFWALGLIWGSSFLLIRVGVEELSPFQVVFIRTGIAALGLNVLLFLRGKHLPFNFRALVPLIIIGIGNTTIPFSLITWGETNITSGLAAMLQSTASLFTLVLAHFFFADERISLQKIVGLSVGFLGVIVLASRSMTGGRNRRAAVIRLAGDCAGIAVLRHFHHLQPQADSKPLRADHGLDRRDDLRRHFVRHPHGDRAAARRRSGNSAQHRLDRRARRGAAARFPEHVLSPTLSTTGSCANSARRGRAW